MMKLSLLTIAALIWLAVFVPRTAMAELESPTTTQVESRVASIESRLLDYASSTGVLFLYGAFCALWAQNTRRSPWLWFVLGVFLSFAALLILLSRNSLDTRRHDGLA